MSEALLELPNITAATVGGERHSILKRTVVVASTDDMSGALREAALHTGVAIAEYYRDMGCDVALLVDSMSHWADALRDLAARRGQSPSDAPA